MIIIFALMFRFSLFVVMAYMLMRRFGPKKWFTKSGDYILVAGGAPSIVRFIDYIYTFFLACFYLSGFALIFNKMAGGGD